MAFFRDNPFRNGILLVLAAENCFVLATVFAKYAGQAEGVPGIEMSFLRFLTGTVVAAAVVFSRADRSWQPVSTGTVFLRALTNTVAVMLFFAALDTTTVTNANLLNMTYPVFVFFFAPFITGETNRRGHYALLVLAMAGIWLVLRPDTGTLAIGDLYGLGSGIAAGLSIPFLRRARRTDGVWTIILWLMTTGMLVNLVFVWPVFVWPTEPATIAALAAGALLGVAGQLMLTTGYRTITATAGSIVSSSRILFAAILGIVLFSEELTFSLAAGAALIVLALFGANRTTK